MKNKRFDWFRVLHNNDLTALVDKLTNHVLSTYSKGSQGVDTDARESKISHRDCNQFCVTAYQIVLYQELRIGRNP